MDYPVYEAHAELAQRHYDLAVFLLSLEEDRRTDAEFHLREAVSVDETHADSLLDLATLLLERRETRSAEVFLTGVVDLRPSTPLLWALRALYYEHLDEGNYDEEAKADWDKEDAIFAAQEQQRRDREQQNKSRERRDDLLSDLSSDNYAENERREAGLPSGREGSAGDLKRAHTKEDKSKKEKEKEAAGDVPAEESATVTSWRDAFEEVEMKKPIARCESLRCLLATFLLSRRCLRMAALVLDHDERHPSAQKSLLARAALKVHLALRQGDLGAVETAVQNISKLALDDGQILDVISKRGLLYWKQGLKQKACESFDRYLEWQPPNPDPMVLWRRGLQLLKDRDFAKLKQYMVILCSVRPCASSWLQVAVACIELKEYVDARRALVEANLLDVRNPRVWGYLALLGLLTGTNSERAFRRALTLVLTDAPLLIRIARLYLRQGFLQAAEEALRTAIELDNTAEARLLLGHVHGHNRLLELQLAEYEKAGELAGDDAALCAEIEASIKTAIQAQR